MIRRLRPVNESAVSSIKASFYTYHIGGYSELIELLLVICPRLRAVVGNKD
jgi:hypothetical protein